MAEDQQYGQCAPCTNAILYQLSSITSVLTFTCALLFAIHFYIRAAQERKIQRREIHIESNAHLAGMQEITWAIAAVKESIKATGDCSEDANEIFGSISRLLASSERELDQLTCRSLDFENLGEKREWRRMRFRS